MDREGFRNRLKQYKKAREENPGLKYWEFIRNNVDENGNIVSTKESPIYTEEYVKEQEQKRYAQKVVDEIKSKQRTFDKERADTDRAGAIPYISEKSITLTNAGKDTGVTLSTNVLDSIAKYAKNAELSLSSALGLAGLESTFGKGYNAEAKEMLPSTLVSNWNYGNPYGRADRSENPYLGLWNAAITKVNGHMGHYDSNLDFIYDLKFIDVLKGGLPYADKLAKRLRTDIPVLEHAFRKYKSGLYNPKDPDHTRMVEERGKALMKSPEIQKWLKEKQNYADGGEVRDNTYVAPIEKEQVFIPTTGELKRKQELLNKLSRNGQIKSGAIDVVSPEFDLLTLGRGLFTNVLTPKGNITNLPINDDSYYRMITDLFYGKSKRVGAINDIFNSNIVRTKNSIFRSPMFSKGKPYYNPDDYNNAYYIVSNNKKGLKWSTVDHLGNPNNNPQGVAFTPLYNGKPNIAPKDYFNIYKYLGDGKYQQIISNLKVVPITGLNLVSENVEQYADGGEVTNSRQKVLDRANKVASNYSDAKDFDLNPFMYAIRKFAKNTIGKGGISNCTLSATGWVDPNNQYMSAKNIFDNPGSGYTEIDKVYALPGDLLIAKNPKEGSYHTMLIEGFDGDTPLLRYSKGGHNTKKNLVTNRSLEEYHKLDNEQGGNHTEDHYFRYNFPNEFWLPEVVITPEKYADGGEVGDATQQNSIDKGAQYRQKMRDYALNWYNERLKQPEYQGQIGDYVDGQWLLKQSITDALSKDTYMKYDDFVNTYGRPVAQGGLAPYGGTLIDKNVWFGRGIPTWWHEGIGHIVGDNTRSIINAAPDIKIQTDSGTVYDDYVNLKKEKNASIWEFRGANINRKDAEGNNYIDPNRKLTADDVQQMIDSGAYVPTQWKDSSITAEDIATMHNTFANNTVKKDDPYQIQFAAEGGIIGNSTIKRKTIKKKKRKM